MAALLGIVDTENWNDMEEEEKSRLTNQREKPLRGETARMWAIQDQDAGPGTRQLLPKWITKPIEMAVMRWGEERQKWERILHERDGSLTKAQKKAYEEWMDTKQEAKLLFDKRKQCQVTKLRANVSMKNVAQNMVSILIGLSEDPSKLSIKAGKHSPRQLLLLEMQADDAQKASCPDFLAAGVDEALVAEVQASRDENAEDDEVEPAELDGEDVQGALDEADCLLEAEQALQDDVDPDAWEVLAESSDDEVANHIHTGIKKVKAFHHRPAFLELENVGLTMVPSHIKGMYLSFHKTTSTWQGFYPGCHSGLSFTFGGTTGRAWAESL